MKKITQHQIAIKVGISPAFLSQIINNKRRPSWPVAKKLALITQTTPDLWMEGDTTMKFMATQKTQMKSAG